MREHGNSFTEQKSLSYNQVLTESGVFPAYISPIDLQRFKISTSTSQTHLSIVRPRCCMTIPALQSLRQTAYQYRFYNRIKAVIGAFDLPQTKPRAVDMNYGHLFTMP